MALAELNAMRSKDPQTQVGCVIVNHWNQVVATGYNGLPRNLDDDKYPWSRNNKVWLDNKYPYVVHAELNAIVSARTDLSKAILYTTLFPCNECAKLIIQAGIERIYFGDDKYKDSDINKAAKQMLLDAKIKFEPKPLVKINLKTR